jgi:hypothetical protein
MCLEVLKNPVGSLVKAKKQKNINKTMLVLVESAILFALTAGITILKVGAASQLAMTLAVATVVSVFVAIFVIFIVLGYILNVIVNILGGSGKYFEGLTVVSYALLPASVALFIGSILSFIPVAGVILNFLVLALGFAAGFSLIYRGVKEMYKTDMVVALIAVSVLMLVFFITITFSLGFSALSMFNHMIPAGV